MKASIIFPVIVIVIVIAIIIGMTVSNQSSVTTPVTTATEISIPSSTPLSTATSTALTTYTLAHVAKHPNATSCWSAVNGKVYDLTSWISKHPGGSQAILSICGKDGSEAFNAQHGGSAQPVQVLQTFYLGELAK